ncbi:Rpn family recombination-promoting nuclease/putative transposase [Blautia sp. SG-772]|nr:Rpn family recombination-promoting nuclease/putative transposase [Blautia sp. SG-772]
MNKKTGGTEDRWRVLLSPHTERSMRMQQMTNHRPLAELDLLDDFLFNALLAYPEYGKKFCRKFLKILFGREFKNLNIVTQKSYGGRDTGLHGARLDVYIEEGDEVEIDSSNVSAIYDIEPDKNNKRKDIDFIAQRTRFYHAIIDSRSLKSGQSYDKLKRVFVIFICPYDPFGDDRMIYTIRNHCVENPELPYEDGARTIFLYTKGRKGRDNESLSQLLDYMENTTRENAVSEELEAIQEMVDVVKKDAEVTVAYMKGFERDQMFLEEGKKQERENTLKEKQRADEEQKRADAAAEEIAKLRKQLEELQNSQN